MVAVAFFALVASASEGEDWFRYRGPDLNGISSESILSVPWDADGPDVPWRTQVGTGLSSVAISEGSLYTIGNEANTDTVVCLSTHDGEVFWKHSYPCPTDPNEFEGGPTSTPTVDGDRVYTLSRTGDLFCFDKRTGDVVWSTNVAEETEVRIPAWGFAGSPLVYGDLLILNVGDAGAAFQKSDGTLVWKSDDKDSGYATPVPFQDKAIILASARSYVAVDASTGGELWRQRWLTTFGCNAADPIIQNNQVFLSSGYNRGSALLKVQDGEPEVVWKNKDLQNQISTSVLIDGHIYGIHGDVDNGTELRCIEFATGELKWATDAVRPGGLSAAGDRLVILSGSGELVIAGANAAQFDPVCRHFILDEKCWTAPVVSQGKIYCRSVRGDLACIVVQ
ncbi:PQQ-binding-like beta-propeller repeat protein [Neorhodopirellula pilleata]|uniref:PQQ-binding-like beta-propeller repeat protein n=1 Tax=Neorhodopirellula pilleata TaxID=2714738 RepID=UPI0018CE1A74|nr:PQQ-binding-like beta-propeller repeat protein [Neorhodopirellula pilleata]